jgi:Ca2+-binding RTX toxin-like protein
MMYSPKSVSTGTPGDDLIRFAWRPGNEVQVRVNGVIHDPYAATKVVAYGLEGADDIKIDKVLGLPPVEFHGGPGNDRLTSAFANDQLFGDDGRDLLYAGNGHDRLFGGDGDDNLFGDNGNDVLYGEDGNDRLRGYTGNDLIFGGAGRDYIVGDNGDNVLVGGDGADRLGGDGGRNIVIGGSARDIVGGGNGGAILISGTTAFDQNESALLALLAEWASSRSLAQRVARLTAGVGPGNQYALSLGVTVQNDNASSVLEGGDGEDWFFKFRKDTLVDADAQVDEITGY